MKPSKNNAPPRKVGRPPAPENETGADRFKRLASSRTNNALRSINALGTLNGKGYESHPEQIALIETVLLAAIKAVIEKLCNKNEKKVKQVFTL